MTEPLAPGERERLEDPGVRLWLVEYFAGGEWHTWQGYDDRSYAEKEVAEGGIEGETRITPLYAALRREPLRREVIEQCARVVEDAEYSIQPSAIADRVRALAGEAAPPVQEGRREEPKREPPLGGVVCSHGHGVLVTHINDALPCSDYLLAAPPSQHEGSEQERLEWDAIFWCLARLKGHARGDISDAELTDPADREQVATVSEKAFAQFRALRSAALRREPAPLERERIQGALTAITRYDRAAMESYLMDLGIAPPDGYEQLVVKVAAEVRRALSGEVAAPREERETDTTQHEEVGDGR